MIIKDLIVQVYDIEIFPNCFSLTIKNTETKEFQFFELSDRKNNLVEKGHVLKKIRKPEIK